MSVLFRCPNCNAVIDNANVNIATDLAKCPSCGAIHKASALVHKTEAPESLNPPYGSKITYGREVSGGMRIELPAKGLSLSDVPQFFFSIFWLGFISFWTWGAAHGSIIFAMFSIPFWIVGILMVGGLINNISERQIITMDRTTLRMEKKRTFGSKTREFSFPEIYSIKMLEYKRGPFSQFANPRLTFRSRWAAPPITPAVVAGTGTFYFFEGANDAEQEWVVALLDSKMRQLNR